MDSELFSNRLGLSPLADDVFVQRWSPRSMVKGDVPDEDLKKMLDAARWSPSCFNDQPWHFLFSTPKTHTTFLDLIVDGNKVWCQNASRIGFVLARKHFAHDGSPNAWSQFDTGAAWMSFVLQAYAMGYVIHGLGGIHKQEVYGKLHIDDQKYDVICGLVIGKRGEVESLPEAFQAREKPTPRNELKTCFGFDQMSSL